MQDLDVCIPLPLQIVLDDVGWWSGSNDSRQNGPYRTGISRRHVPADYLAVAELGRRLDMRPQAAMVLCEWDRENILKNVPSATWMGKNWDNRVNVGPQLDEAAEIIRSNNRHFEFTLHGLGHEFWHRDGTFSRAEWADDAGLRSETEIKLHLDYFYRIMEMNKLGGFPKSFVPCAFKYTFGGNNTLTRLLREAGIEYVSTPLDSMKTFETPQFKLFGIDASLFVVDRGTEPGVAWYAIGGEAPEKMIEGCICGLHWPNILHENPEQNLEVVERWVEYFEAHNKVFTKILARDTFHHRAQLAYCNLADLQVKEEALILDFSRFFKLFDQHFHEGMTVRIKNNRKCEAVSGDARLTVKEDSDFTAINIIFDDCRQRQVKITLK